MLRVELFQSSTGRLLIPPLAIAGSYSNNVFHHCNVSQRLCLRFIVIKVKVSLESLNYTAKHQFKNNNLKIQH